MSTIHTNSSNQLIFNSTYVFHFINANIRTHTNIPSIIKYFFQLIFSFNINLDASIVIIIELVLITETIETFPSNNANLLNIEDETSNNDCNIKYPLLFIFLISM